MLSFLFARRGASCVALTPLIICFLFIICTLSLSAQVIPPRGGERVKWSPRESPVITGPFDVAVILVEFQDTELDMDMYEFSKKLDNVRGISQEEYFKIYTNGITWPVIKIYPDDKKENIYKSPHVIGYYCKFDYWYNPCGYPNEEEGRKRVAKLKEDAMKAAKAKNKNIKYRALSYNYITTRIKDVDRLPDISKFYSAGHRNYVASEEYQIERQRKAPRRSKKNNKNEEEGDNKFNPWDFYGPGIGWGEPLWPNSAIQMHNANAFTMAHEIGHVLGAPDLYRVGRYNDGIGGDAALMTYGPTASAFNRFYHHGYVKQDNYPLITQSGTYTLHPRNIKPTGDEKLGYVIPSSHPHYFYQVEYIWEEPEALQNFTLEAEGGDDKNDKKEKKAGVSNVEGMLISVLNLNVSSYLGSPDLLYVYRPEDPYFRGVGVKNDCLFGEKYKRTEFNMGTEPSSRLPNLLDGGIKISNIKEQKGTLSFDVEVYKVPISSTQFKESLLPQIKLHEIKEVMPHSFLMECNVKFRGEPLKKVLGFCWSKKPKPTIQDNRIARIHNDLYKGRAINLEPETTYYVRAWIGSELGVRYSDEELVVKTPPLKDAPTNIEPLLLDKFSNNWDIYSKFSKTAIYSNYRGFTPTAVLGKLMAYYSPDKLGKTVHSSPSPVDSIGKKVKENGKKGKAEPIDFDRLNWNPGGDQPKSRHGETIALFAEANRLGDELHMHEGMEGGNLHKDFLKNLLRNLKPKGKPEILKVTLDNKQEGYELIKKELQHSRPALIVQVPIYPEISKPPQWGLIDGIKDGALHIDFAYGADVYKKRDDYISVDDLVVDGYILYIVAPLDFNRK